MSYLNEDKRQQLLSRSKKGDNYVPSNRALGKNRYQRRVHSKVANSVKEFNQINMNEFFKDSTLNVNVRVQGETDNYLVQIKFGNILDCIHDELEKHDNSLDLRVIIRALISSFNTDDVYIHCSCPDWNYRFSYWSRVNNISADPAIEQTNNGMRIVNPNDTKGAACKHVLIVLSNNTWLNKVASVIYNYINYMKNHSQRLYADVIYPAIYQKPYEEPVQLNIDDVEDIDVDILDTTSDTLDISNKEASTRGRFKKGNQSGIQFASKEQTPETDKQFNLDSLLDSNTM